jgi:hypothetical protein
LQTFLPYADFVKTAKCLDYRRLGKQRVEAFQILNILEGKTTKAGWKQQTDEIKKCAFCSYEMFFSRKANLFFEAG